MAKTTDFYSINEQAKAALTRRYHNNNTCAPGRDIPSWERRVGTAGYKLCEHCATYNSQGR